MVDAPDLWFGIEKSPQQSYCGHWTADQLKRTSALKEDIRRDVLRDLAVIDREISWMQAEIMARWPSRAACSIVNLLPDGRWPS